MSQALMSNYARLPVAFARGEGAWLWDTEGKRYLDAMAGIAVCGLGHCHPAVTEAVCQQAATLLHTSNLYEIPHQSALAEKLCALSGLDKAFFCNSGAEANEAAIKLARLYGHKRGIAKPAIIVTEGSFHGRTLATLTATGNPKIQQGFDPLVEGFVRVPFDDLEAIARIGQTNADVVAVLLEPITGEGGIRVPGDDYLDGIRALCDRHGWLMMLDEIQAGIGRTGTWFAFQHTQARPDVMTLAKGLGNGVPLGACLARGEAAGLFTPGTHGTTFGGNPLVSRAGLAVLETMEKEGVLKNAAEQGRFLLEGLRQRLGGLKGVMDIRGKGLMLGIQLDHPCKPLMQQAMDEGLLINVTADSVVRLLPPLIIDRAQAQAILDTVCGLVQRFLTE